VWGWADDDFLDVERLPIGRQGNSEEGNQHRWPRSKIEPVSSARKWLRDDAPLLLFLESLVLEDRSIPIQVLPEIATRDSLIVARM